MLRYIVPALALGLIATVADAETIWDNGSNGQNGAGCNSNNAACGYLSWTVYDDFFLTTGTTVSGFTYDTTLLGSTYYSTVYSLWNSDPLSSAGPVVSGTIAGTSVAIIGGSRITVTGFNILLGSGTWWLGLSNNASGLTTYMLSGTSKLGAASQASGNGQYKNRGLYDAAFTIQGTPATTNSVAEPATWAMMIAGFGLVGRAMRRRRVPTLA